MVKSINRSDLDKARTWSFRDVDDIENDVAILRRVTFLYRNSMLTQEGHRGGGIFCFYELVGVGCLIADLIE